MNRFKLTRAQRQEVYNAALEFYYKGEYYNKYFGLCFAVDYCDCDIKRPKMCIYPTQYPELFKHAPKFSERYIHWWPLRDRAIRISVLKQAIEETKPL